VNFSSELIPAKTQVSRLRVRHIPPKLGDKDSHANFSLFNFSSVGYPLERQWGLPSVSANGGKLLT